MRERHLKRISELFDELKDLHSSLNPRPYDLTTLVQKLILEIEELHKIDPTLHCDLIMKNLRHTLNKEVSFVDIAYKKTLKKNAAQKRTSDYYNSMREALKYIKIDIYSLLMIKPQD